MIKGNDIIEQLEKRLHSFSLDDNAKNIGIVQKNNDGVITASGLSQAVLGEIVEFKKGEKGLVLNLNEDTVSIILLGRGDTIVEGDEVKTTGTLLSIPVSKELLGRVIDPLGKPLDGKPALAKGTAMPLERIAAGVVERQPVDTPLKTGIKGIDVIAIGRGQRELIIGDRGLGKTTVAIDTIINQKQYQKSKVKGVKPVVCVYVAIGQKQSTVAQVIDKLKTEGALDYTVVVSASASAPAAMQYLAPYAGTAVAEYFMEKGEDVLVVYDDLTKHAWAYRQLTLTLGRPAGREAYPGDVFYLHSRLLERSVRMNEKNGGGSITSLPIIETQAGDISAYIPTNVISITDGQIFLESNLFNSGFRPAVNMGNSVSRVGGAAQTSAMKSVAGKLRLDLAQFRSLEAFAQFGSELDSATQQQLERGRRVSQILIQPQYQPLPEAFQILSLWVATSGNLDDIPVADVQRFEGEFHDFVKSRHKKLIEELSNGKKVTKETIEMMQKAADEFKKVFTK